MKDFVKYLLFGLIFGAVVLGVFVIFDVLNRNVESKVGGFDVGSDQRMPFADGEEVSAQQNTNNQNQQDQITSSNESITQNYCVQALCGPGTEFAGDSSSMFYYPCSCSRIAQIPSEMIDCFNSANQAGEMGYIADSC